jgi:LPS O-antigen subunit length determinant protein (WzzB/FepE family)
MKKNNPYITDDEIDLGDLLRTLWREKVLILSISIICGLLGYLYASFKPEEFKTYIKLKNPPSQLFETYIGLIGINNNNNNITTGQFISDFKLKLLSLDNFESFVQESRDLDNFKAYLKSKNITVKKYFKDKKDILGVVKEKNIIIPDEYFFVFDKKILEGDIVFNNYVEFTKKKIIIEFKKDLKTTIENKIVANEQALETAKLINLENPIIKSLDRQVQVVNEPEALFYKGTKVLSQNIIYLKRLLQKLENDQLNYNPILDKASLPVLQNTSVSLFFVSGLILGFLISLVIIFLRNILKKKL